MIAGQPSGTRAGIGAHNLTCQVLEVFPKVGDFPHFRLSKPCCRVCWKHWKYPKNLEAWRQSGVLSLSRGRRPRGAVEVTQDIETGRLGSSLALPFTHLPNLGKLMDRASVSLSLKRQQR